MAHSSVRHGPGRPSWDGTRHHKRPITQDTVKVNQSLLSFSCDQLRIQLVVLPVSTASGSSLVCLFSSKSRCVTRRALILTYSLNCTVKTRACHSHATHPSNCPWCANCTAAGNKAGLIGRVSVERSSGVKMGVLRLMRLLSDKPAVMVVRNSASLFQASRPISHTVYTQNRRTQKTIKQWEKNCCSGVRQSIENAEKKFSTLATQCRNVVELISFTDGPWESVRFVAGRRLLQKFADLEQARAVLQGKHCRCWFCRPH